MSGKNVFVYELNLFGYFSFVTNVTLQNLRQTERKSENNLVHSLLNPRVVSPPNSVLT